MIDTKTTGDDSPANELPKLVFNFGSSLKLAPALPRHLAWDGESWQTSSKDGTKWEPCLALQNWSHVYDQIEMRFVQNYNDVPFTHDEVSIREAQRILANAEVLDLWAPVGPPPDRPAFNPPLDLSHQLEDGEWVHSGRGAPTYVRIWTAAYDRDGDREPINLRADFQTVVFCNSGVQETEEQWVMHAVDPWGQVPRFVIHLGPDMAHDKMYGDVFNNEPHELVLFCDSLESVTPSVLMPFLMAFLVPNTWFASPVDESDPLPRRALDPTSTERGKLSHGTIVNESVVIPEETLALLNEWFEVDVAPGATLGQFVREFAEGCYGADVLAERCDLFSYEEYEAHIGTEAFKIENGDELLVLTEAE
jgi:hypothetical protein